MEPVILKVKLAKPKVVGDPELKCMENGKEWRVEGLGGKWANCEIVLTRTKNGKEKLTVIKDGIRVCSWTRKGYHIKPPKKR